MASLSITLRSSTGHLRTTTSRETAELLIAGGWRLLRVVGTLRGTGGRADV